MGRAGVEDGSELMHLYARALAVVLLMAFTPTGCVRRDGRNSDCKWPRDSAASSIYPGQRGYERHLRDDVEFAQELAVEYMDARHRTQSGQFEPQQGPNQALNACLHTLMAQIAESHNISSAEAGKFFGRRSLAIDFAMTLPFLLLYVFLAEMVVGTIRRRYPLKDGWVTTLVMITFSSLVFGVGGMMLGEQWGTLAENIRVGTGHLSYRVGLLPWVRHESGFFVLYLVLFWTVVVVKLSRSVIAFANV